MTRAFRSLVALVLAFAWMPLTAHCAIEASGVLDSCAASCCDEADDCAESPCSIVSKGDYSPATPVVKVFAPGVVRWTEAAVLLTPPSHIVIGRSSVRIDRPPDWVVCWHVLRRAAGLPRAPAPGA